MNKNTLVALIVIAVLALGGWYYYSQQKLGDTGAAQNTNDSNMNGTPSDTSANTPAGGMETGTVPENVSTSVSTGPEKDLAVSGFNFGFSPSTLTVKRGDHVKITFTNSGGMHDFKIDEFNVATSRIGTGESATVEFDATKAGTFQYYCSVANHRAMGMWGTLTVTE
ncbi:cupredoxin domain-containing protein [Candidatus Kaiserbacteria bacterium]|nr:cupredoxin domain-containing protein [Candidatus Kaiserbacteria bacterium]